jgi:hypothetical protein
MANWFRRNANTKKYSDLESVLSRLLNLQRVLIVDFSLEVSGAVNNETLGYIYGFIDCAAQIQSLEINCEEGRRLVTNILESLQHRHGKPLMARLAGLARDKEFTDGVKAGGAEYNNWVKMKGGFTPVGLGRSFYRRRASDG